MSETMRAKLIEAGVRNLKEFGYPSVNKTNILTDKIYSRFFDGMLEENLGKGYDREINALRDKIAEPSP